MKDNKNKIMEVEQKKDIRKKDSSLAAVPAFINAFVFFLMGITRIIAGMGSGTELLVISVILVLMGISLTLGLRKMDKKNKDK
ncbi:MAG: hypothetical protein IIZ09_08715 [Ruminococcus sp.]|nr:hypothetical protein [Ruminococcus sp.]